MPAKRRQSKARVQRPNICIIEHTLQIIHVWGLRGHDLSRVKLVRSSWSAPAPRDSELYLPLQLPLVINTSSPPRQLSLKSQAGEEVVFGFGGLWVEGGNLYKT